ncbi:MAG: hypothetical protein ACTSP4_14545 [Candidatus Hodarchaeales archaeon]
MRIIGPNCIGIINIHCKNGVFNCTWFPFELEDNNKGNISIASQSGSWITQITNWAEKRGLRLGKAISVGNEANVDITDCLEYYLEDPCTKTVGLYVEGIKKNGRKFVNTLTELSDKKPVVVYYSGGTTAGSRAGMSHTASIGGAPEIYDSIIHSSGAIKAGSIEELYEFLHAFSKINPPKGKRMGLITNSGGPAVTLADLCEKNGLLVPQYSASLQSEIRAIIPKVASPGNPVDLTFDLNFDLFYNQIPQLVWESGEVDALILYGVFGGSSIERTLDFANQAHNELFQVDLLDGMLLSTLEEFTAWVYEEKIPVMISCIDTGERAVKYLQDNGIPIFKFPNMTVKAMKAVVDYYAQRAGHN